MSAFLCDEYLSTNQERRDIVCENGFLCQLKRALWSALTCQRFGKRRLVAARLRFSERSPRQVAAFQSGDKSPHSKFVFPRRLLDSGVSKSIIFTSAVGR